MERVSLRGPLVALIGLAVTATSVSGCGTEDDDGVPSFQSKHQSDVVLGDMSSADATGFCAEAAAYVGDSFTEVALGLLAAIREPMCTVAGIMSGAYSAGNQELACSTAKDACMREPADTSDDFGEVDVCTAGDLTNCGATVEEMAACLEDAVAAFGQRGAESAQAIKDAMAGISCDPATWEQASDIDVMPTDMDIEPPASCAAVGAKCPGLEME